MTDEPLRLPRSITLRTGDEIAPKLIRDWLRCVTDAAPSGVVGTAQVRDDKGLARSVKLVHRQIGEGRKTLHEYLVPLVRDLSADETERVVRAFADDHPDLDFDVETTGIVANKAKTPSITLDDERHLALCTALAKQRHTDWLRERTGAGWRYGPSFSQESKTHPLILPWEQLPDRFKKPDLHAPQTLIDHLGEDGYAVVAKDDIKRLSDLLRGVM